jgi:photosystem II stability/assembly factor-like uncharacterized protein
MSFANPTAGWAAGFPGSGRIVKFAGNLHVPPQVWTPQTISPTAKVFAVKAIDDNVVWAGADSGRYLRTTNGGTTWVTGFIPGASSLVMNSIAPINRDTAYFEGTNFSGGDGRIYKTTNGGTTWALQYQNTAPEVFFNSIAFWDHDNGIAESDAVAGSFFVVTTTNGGATWNQTPAANIPPPLAGEFGGFGDGGGTVLAVQGTNNAWFGTAYGPGTSRICRVFRTTNKGQSWSVANTPFVGTNPFFGAATIVFRDAQNGFVGAATNTGAPLARTSDGGVTWSLVPSFPSSSLVGTLAYIPGTNYNGIVASGIKFAFSRDGGIVWDTLSSSILFGATSFASSTTGWGGTVIPGELFKYTGSPLTTVEEQKNETAPSAFALHQNYPNPFNPTTEIKFAVAENGRATLEVFNILGQKVATLFDDVAESGRYYNIKFNAVNFASGVYLYRLQSAGQVQVRRLLLLR